jgi:hypothetical protein
MCADCRPERPLKARGGEGLAGGSGLAERTLQQTGHVQNRRIPLEIFAIQSFALDADNPDDVAPCRSDTFPALAIPAKFLQKDLFRPMDL